VSFELLVGPPGAGKTRALLERARELTLAGARVWWAGLPGQRAGFYRRATENGPLLGLEFQTLQQVCYRLLAHARALEPLIVGTGRLALVGEALVQERGELPTTGEARLFAGAIAEAKRYGLGVADLPSGDGEVERLRGVYAAYERLKGEAWDYDDFRRAALALAESGAAVLEADALFVDGLSEIGPLDLRLLRALAARWEVRLSLPEAPAGVMPTRVLEHRASSTVSAFTAPNPVVESRWVLRALKRDLASGMDPLDLAVVLPEGESVAFAALADEYGVPVMDERRISLADTVAGRLLLELLELPEYPTASRLLPIRELAPLANATLEAGIAGRHAITQLAERLNLLELWRRWLEWLEVPGDQDVWASWLVDHAVAMAGESAEQGGMSAVAFRRHALGRAKEAGRVASGPGLRAWWAALLKESSLSHVQPGGVALLEASLASGRRYRRAYLMRAVEGAYGTGEREDYFVPEEARAPLMSLYRAGVLALPRRFAGRDRLLFADLRALADHVTVTVPEADQSGPLLAERALTAGLEPQPLPVLPAGSRLELSAGQRYHPQGGPRELGEASLEELRRYDECAMRFWLERQLPPRGGPKNDEPNRRWLDLVFDLRSQPDMTQARLERLAHRHGWAARWLLAHRERLLELSFGVTLPAQGSGPRALLDAARRSGREADLYLFTEPLAAMTSEQAEAHLDGRWNELWAAGHLLQRYRGRIDRVQVVVWPVLGEPVEAYRGEGIRYRWKRITSRMERAEAAWESFSSGSIDPSPGFQCSQCPVRDICREGAR
jgi:ATP-dependent helicase/nuclease subunit B